MRSSKIWLQEHDLKPIKSAHITKNFIKYRITPPKRGEYYSKYITPEIFIVFSNDADGGFDISRYIKGFYKAIVGNRDNLKPSVRDLLSQIGDKPINSLYVQRKPISSKITTILNITNNVSGNKEIHDDLFHLYIVVEIDNLLYKLEKNEDINLDRYQGDVSPQDNVKINNIPNNLTLNSMIQNTINKIGEHDFFNYDAFSTNCQHFILNVLKSNNINISPELHKFIMQNVSDIAPEFSKKISYYVTSLKNRLNLISEGYGIIN
jgi:hypothetical protein